MDAETETYDRCPDCSAVVNRSRKRLAHNPTCPVGLGVANVTDSDREWLASHPKASYRNRKASWAEAVEHRLMNGQPPVAGAELRVLVWRLPFGRIREFRWVPLAVVADGEV